MTSFEAKTSLHKIKPNTQINVFENKSQQLQIDTERIAQSISSKAQELNIPLPINWEQELPFFIQKHFSDNFPPATAELLKVLTALFSKKVEILNLNEIDRVLQSTRKEIWVVFAFQERLEVMKLLENFRPKQWSLNDLPPETAKSLRENDIVTEKDFCTLLGREDTYLLERHKYINKPEKKSLSLKECKQNIIRFFLTHHNNPVIQDGWNLKMLGEETAKVLTENGYTTDKKLRELLGIYNIMLDKFKFVSTQTPTIQTETESIKKEKTSTLAQVTTENQTQVETQLEPGTKKPSIKINQICAIIEEESKKLKIVLPNTWKKDFQYFYENYRSKESKKKPIAHPKALALICKALDNWLTKPEYSKYNSEKVQILRESVRKRIWIILNQDKKQRLIDVLETQQPQTWYFNNLKKWDESLRIIFYNNRITSSEDLADLLGKSAFLLDKYKLIEKQETIDWTEEKIEQTLDQFIQFELIPKEEWGPKKLENTYGKFYATLRRLNKLSEKDFLQIMGEEIGKELFSIYPYKPREIINKDTETVKNRLINEFFFVYLKKTGTEWDFYTHLKEWDENLYKLLSNNKQLSIEGIRDILGEDANLMLQMFPYKKTTKEDVNWVKEGANKNKEYWSEDLARIAMSRFFIDTPKAQSSWSHTLLERWNPGLVKWLKANYRINNDPDWKTIILNFVPEKYQNKFTWMGIPIYFKQSEIGLEWINRSSNHVFDPTFIQELEDERQLSPEDILIEKEKKIPFSPLFQDE